jgi:outer membrane protein assembly factor BamB
MARQMQLSLALVLIIEAALATSARAENWPQWRGPRNNGVSSETGLPTKWSKTENMVWRLPLPGQAGATPIIWGDRIFLTSADGNDLVLMCASTDGKQLWKKAVSVGNRSVNNNEGNMASPSPSTDGKYIWTFFGTGDLACFDFEGNEIWKFNVQDRYGRFQIQWGMAVTPLLDGDRLYLSILQSGGGSRVIAFDKSTGNEIWQAKRPSDARSECEQSYASPVIYRDGGHEFLLTHGADYIVAHSLKDGSELWRCGGLNIGRYNPSLRFVATPSFGPGLIVVPSAKNGPVLGLSPDGEGDITSSDKGHLWTRRSGTPDVPSPLVHDGLVYLCDEGGLMTCLDAKTGEEYYTKKRAHADRHRASPVFADGKLYITARDGHVDVVKAGKEFEILADNDMGEFITSSPVISNGTLYLRTFEGLYAIREGAQTVAASP